LIFHQHLCTYQHRWQKGRLGAKTPHRSTKGRLSLLQNKEAKKIIRVGLKIVKKNQYTLIKYSNILIEQSTTSQKCVPKSSLKQTKKPVLFTGNQIPILRVAVSFTNHCTNCFKSQNYCFVMLYKCYKYVYPTLLRYWYFYKTLTVNRTRGILALNYAKNLKSGELSDSISICNRTDGCGIRD